MRWVKCSSYGPVISGVVDGSGVEVGVDVGVRVGVAVVVAVAVGTAVDVHVGDGATVAVAGVAATMVSVKVGATTGSGVAVEGENHSSRISGLHTAMDIPPSDKTSRTSPRRMPHLRTGETDLEGSTLSRGTVPDTAASTGVATTGEDGRLDDSSRPASFGLACATRVISS
jgi:hypothetical protein